MDKGAMLMPQLPMNRGDAQALAGVSIAADPEASRMLLAAPGRSAFGGLALPASSHLWEGFTRGFENCRLAVDRSVAVGHDIDIARIKLDPETATAYALRGDQGLSPTQGTGRARCRCDGSDREWHPSASPPALPSGGVQDPCGCPS